MMGAKYCHDFTLGLGDFGWAPTMGAKACERNALGFDGTCEAPMMGGTINQLSWFGRQGWEAKFLCKVHGRQSWAGLLENEKTPMMREMPFECMDHPLVVTFGGWTLWSSKPWGMTLGVENLWGYSEFCRSVCCLFRFVFLRYASFKWGLGICA